MPILSPTSIFCTYSAAEDIKSHRKQVLPPAACRRVSYPPSLIGLCPRSGINHGGRRSPPFGLKCIPESYDQPHR